MRDADHFLYWVGVTTSGDPTGKAPALPLHGAQGAPQPALPSVDFCARLLDSAAPAALCQIITDEVSSALRASWVAALHVSGEARAFEVAGSVGEVPSVLHDCRDMTPAELAGALGWNARRPGAQLVQNHRSTVSRALAHEGGTAAFAVLAGDHIVGGIVVAGWNASGMPGPTDLGTLTALSEAGAAALRHAALVADLRMSERTKSEFVATMSHELRNPLSAILGYTDLLVHGDFGALGEEQAEVLRRAHHSASSLLDLINATLDVSRFEVGSDVVQSSQVDLSTVLRDEVEEMSRGRRQTQVEVVRDDHDSSIVIRRSRQGPGCRTPGPRCCALGQPR